MPNQFQKLSSLAIKSSDCVSTHIFRFTVDKITQNHYSKVSKGAKIRNRYNQVPRLTQDTNGKVTNSQLGTTNESQEVCPFPAGDHKAHINRRARRHSKHKAEQKQASLQNSYLFEMAYRL